MSALNFLCPTHAELAKALSGDQQRVAGGPPAESTSNPALTEEQIGKRRLERFDPWLLGMTNMIEEGDWHNACLFCDEIRLRLRQLALDEMADEAGIVKRH